MRSLARSDTLTGLIVSAVLVAGAASALHAIDVHTKEHGHDVARAACDVEGAQHRDGECGREGQHGCGGHASFFATARLSDAVRRDRNGSDTP